MRMKGPGWLSARWSQVVIALWWALSLLFLYAYLDSRLQQLRMELSNVVKNVKNYDNQNPIHSKNEHPSSESITDNSNGPISSDTFNPENSIIFYNRIPKTASTTFANGVIYALCKQNQYSALHLNISRNSHTLTLPDQLKFIQNISNWSERKPAVYHGHVAFVNFEKFGAPNPIYINILREPLDRFLSYYYFLRYGDKYRPHIVRKRAGDDETFDDCVKRNGKDCQAEGMWLQIPFFCGHAAECWIPGNEWALEEAKRNLVEHYLLVGVVEELEDFISLLEVTLPRFFKGALSKFHSGKNSYLRQTKRKIDPQPETLDIMRETKVYKLEYEFYHFAKEQFRFLRERILQDEEKKSKDDPPFHYEKIKPKLAL